MLEHLKELNNKQKEAAEHINGPMLIVAGAGAGKTKTITHKIVNLIKNGVSPEQILAVTFTNKAAKEMRERIGGAILRYGTLGRNGDDGQRKFSVENFRGDRTQYCEPFISTFHSLGVYIIKENARILGLTKYFSILDENDAKSMIKDILKELNFDPKEHSPGKIKAIISIEKGRFTSLEKYQESITSVFQEMVVNVWKIYEEKKKKENSLDFDDLLLKATKLLKENEQIRKIYQEKWKYIHIDEYQDTNEVQYLMTKMLAENNKNITVVGDADQNIYSWRGANLKNILNFEKDYPDAKIVLLEQNYRSTQNILEAANIIIKKNKHRPDKNLFTKNDLGEKIGLYEALNENDEADFVATKILEIMESFATSNFLPLRPSLGASGSKRDPRGQKIQSNSAYEGKNFRGESENILSSVAILYRANFQSRALEEAMLRYNIPYQVLGIKFFERKEIKDTLSYLRAALNKESLSDIKRIINFPARGIGKVTLLKIFASPRRSLGEGWANDIENLPIKMKIKINNFYKILEEIKEKIEQTKTSEVIKFVVKKSGIENELSSGTEEDKERLENIKELATLALKYDNLKNGLGIEKLLEDASLASDQDSLIVGEEKKKVNAVKLMTMHASKGLEFKYVFITGLEDGLFPHERHNEDSPASAQGFGEAKEEERRLFYVAVTRAKEKLFLSFANFRTIFGARNINTPSEFISDIPANLLEKEGEKDRIKTIYI